MLKYLMVAFSLAIALPAGADALKKPEIFADFRGLAIKGYDTVAYHTEGRPVKGDPAFAVEWKGATWLFASAANREAFVAEPDRFAPEFGGYCAWAVTQGRAVGINPTIFKIVDGRLYLNLNMDVHEKWLAKMPQMIARGNEQWPDALVLAD